MNFGGVPILHVDIGRSSGQMVRLIDSITQSITSSTRFVGPIAIEERDLPLELRNLRPSTYQIVLPPPPSYCPSLDDSQPYLGAPRDLSWHARLSQGLVPPPRVSRGPASRWRPLPVRLVPRVVRRQSRLS